MFLLDLETTKFSLFMQKFCLAKLIFVSPFLQGYDPKVTEVNQKRMKDLFTQ